MFIAEGGFVERFLNLCKINDINLWDVKNDGVKVKAFTSSRDFERINIAAERSGMTIKIEQKKGLKYFANRNKLRVGVALGVLLSAFFTVYLSGCVWNVEVQGKQGVKAEAITQSLADLGVKTGARKSKIDILAVQDEMLRRHKELLWVSLNIFGGRAEFEYTLVNEKTPSPDTFLPTNIVASKKGIITLVECYRGTPVVKEGQFVAEGSVLISGVITNADSTETLTQAMGRVYAKTEGSITAKNGIERMGKISVDIEPCYGLFIFGLDVPFGRFVKSDFASVTRVPLQGNETMLPVGFIRCDYLSFAESEVCSNENMDRLASLLKCVEIKRLQYASAKLKNVVFKSSSKGGEAFVEVKITCIEDISSEKTISVEKN